MSARQLAPVMVALLLSVPAGAQDCPATPLVGRRVALAASLTSAPPAGERRLGASVQTAVRGPLRLGAGYGATRLTNVDRLTHDGVVEMSMIVARGGVTLCPAAGVGYARMTHDTEAEVRGRVDTKSRWAGLSVGRTVVTSTARITPFMQPMLVRRSVEWESVDVNGWRVPSESSESHTHLWLGVSAAAVRHAVVARFRPSIGSTPRAFDVGIVTGLGSR